MLTVKVTLLLLCVMCPSLAELGKPLEIKRELLNAMQYVESRGYSCAVGDNGRSLGPYQIMEGYYNDAVEFNPSLKYGGYKYSNVVGPRSYDYSEKVVMSYMGRYATRQRLGRAPTNEDIARIHNGGPNGFKSAATLPYWIKVNECLQNPELCPLNNKSKRSTDHILQERAHAKRNNVSTCQPACNSAGDCMCSCCSNAGICNCLTNTTFTPCDNSSTSQSNIGAATSMRYDSVTITLILIYWSLV